MTNPGADLRSEPSHLPASCAARTSGLFLGTVQLIERVVGRDDLLEWRPRRIEELNGELSKACGTPVDLSGKERRLASIARALGRGQVTIAKIGALHLVKLDWDPARHPRWPASSPGGAGGRFAPLGTAGPSEGSTAHLTPGQVAIPLPLPWELPIPPIEIPGEVGAPPLIAPREVKNPYPSRPECAEEWAHAERYCSDLQKKGKLGKGDYKQMGKWYYQCLMGQISEECGGNPVA